MSDTLILSDPGEETRLTGDFTAAAKKAPTHSWRNLLLGVLVAALAFWAGWTVANFKAHRQAKESLPPIHGKRDPSAAMVTVEPVTCRAVQRSVEAIGTLHAFEEITISARVEGRVRELRFDVADQLKPGDSLLEIDPTDYELAVEQAERALQVELAKLGLTDLPGSNVELEKVPSVMMSQSRLEKAKLRQERTRKLAASQSISVEELDNANSDYQGALADYANEMLLARVGLATIRMKQTALAIAQQQLRDTQVRVPTPTIQVPGSSQGITYAITQRSVSEGTLVRPGTEICKMVINQMLKLQVPIPDRYSAELHLDQKAEVHTAAFPTPFAGTATRINPAVDPTTRTFNVEIQIPNPEGRLKPGSFAKVSILTRHDEEAVTVPLSAVVNFAGINKVFLLKDGKAVGVHVTPGVQSTEWVEIAKPALPRGTQVITSGQSVLANDTPVEVRATNRKTSTDLSRKDQKTTSS